MGALTIGMSETGELLKVAAPPTLCGHEPEDRGDTPGIRSFATLSAGTIVRVVGSILGGWVKVETTDAVTG